MHRESFESECRFALVNFAKEMAKKRKAYKQAQQNKD